MWFPAHPNNPWNSTITDWQLRHAADVGSQDATELGHHYKSFEKSMRYHVAVNTMHWVQDWAQDAYRPDGPDYWPTLSEILEEGEDDCDGFDLLTFVLLRRFGFAEEEIYRAILVEDSTQLHHMTTLWFDDGPNSDPYVLDPTGIVTKDMVRLGDLGGWSAVEMFDETAHFSPRVGAL